MAHHILDSDGSEVKAGDVISFCYGLPPVKVRAHVVMKNSKLIALTPGHNPSQCYVRELKRFVGGFVIEDAETKEGE